MVTNKRNLGNHTPYKLTEAIIAEIREAMLNDCYFEVACRASGICKKTGYNWFNRGQTEVERIEKGETPSEDEVLCLQFYIAMDQAEAQAEKEDIRYIRYGFKDWQGKAWIRERKNRERWGQRVEHTGEGGGPVQLLVKWDGNRSVSSNTPAGL